MKRLLSIGLLLISLLAACNGNKQVPEPEVAEHGRSIEGPSPELSTIDSLLWRQPDSALAMLQNYLACRDVACNVSNANDTIIEDVAHYVSTTAYDRHYANLLLAELLYKNDYAQTNRAELLQAVGYFDSLALVSIGHTHALRRHCGLDPQSPCRYDNLVFLDARAHYINGVGYYEHDSVVPACKEYLKALEVMEEHFEEEELVRKKAKFMALTYTHLTSLFSDMYLHEQAIYFGKESLKYYQKYDAEPRHIAWMLNIIGLRYDILDSYDSSYFYCNQGLKILPDTNSLTYRDIKTHLIYLSYIEGDSLVKPLRHLYNLISKAYDDKEYYSRCLTIGEIFYQEKQYDSAWNYFNKVYEGTQSVESKKLSAERLVEICKAKGNEYKAMEYADFLVPYANLEENQSATKSQLTEQYKNYGQRRQERVHQQEKMRSLRRTMIIVGSLLVLMLFITILYHKNKKRKQRLETQIEADRYAHEIQQKALSGKLKKSNEALHDALKQLDDNSHIDSQNKCELAKDYFSFVETTVCQHILETVHQQNFKSKIDYLVYKEHALQKEQLLALRVAADKYLDDFTVRLRKHFPNLTDEDVTYCCLYLLDISDADIAALMQKAYPTVCERRRKIKRIIGEENNPNFALRNL